VEKHVNKAFCISLEAGKLKEFMWKIVNPRLKNINSLGYNYIEGILSLGKKWEKVTILVIDGKKLDKYFRRDAEATITMSVQKNRHIVEVTIRFKTRPNLRQLKV